MESRPQNSNPANQKKTDNSAPVRPGNFRDQWQERTGQAPSHTPDGPAGIEDPAGIRIPDSFAQWGSATLFVDERRIKRFSFQELTSLYSYLESEADVADAHAGYLESTAPHRAAPARRWSEALVALRDTVKDEINSQLGRLFYTDIEG
jgi:hypothetical protein